MPPEEPDSTDPELDTALAELEHLHEAGDQARLHRALRRLKKRYPSSLDLLEWEALLALEDGHAESALRAADRVLAEDPRREVAAARRCEALLDLGRFEAALIAITGYQQLVRHECGRAEAAWIHFQRGVCCDRLGRTHEADAAFAAAARADPGEYPKPPRATRDEFEALVAEALDSIPAAFDQHLAQVVVSVEDYPGPDVFDPYILGLYVGVPRTERGEESHDHLDRILVFKRNLEIEFPKPRELREEVRKTVIHEIAHHFGMGEDEMGEYA